MTEHNPSSVPLTVNNYKAVVDRLTSPHKQLIVQAQQNFKQKIKQYKQSREKGSVQYQISASPPTIVPLHLSSKDLVNHQDDDNDVTKHLLKSNQNDGKSKTYELCEWKSQNITSFPDYQHITNYYQQIFSKKKSKSKNKKNYYDFRIDEKDMLVNIFNEIKSEPQCIQFKNVIQFFDKCKLFYLYYNIKPFKLIDILKDSAHTFKDKLTLQQFLNVFFYDRPNITTYDDQDNIYVRKRCVLGEQNWKELRQIFNTLDTFGNETVNLQPFLFKIKNNYGNRQLINEPTIEYPQIHRTIPLKKIIFVLQNRCDCSQKIRWQQIQQIISNFKYISEPTIDTIYHKLIERGEITKSSNYFMLNQQIIDQIKDIFDRCSKYCQYFVKTDFICHELVQSNRIKSLMKDGIVRILQKGTSTYCVKFDQQIRIIATYAEDYIDKDELLQYFSIKGPINTTVETNFDDQADSSDEQNNERLKKLSRIKSMEKLRGVTKKQTKRKGTKYITSCQQFHLTTNNKESIMQRKTRQWVQFKKRQDQLQYCKKIKANPIPVELNPQKYNDYITKLGQIKALKRLQFSKKKKEQLKIYQYLKSNTYLFNKKFKQNQQELPTQQYKFVSKSIPWFVTEVYMLDKINQKKKLRQKQLYSQNRVKIIRQWKKLPEVMIMDLDEISQNHQDNIQKEIVISNEKQNDKIDIKTKTKEVPNFKQLHQQFQEELIKRKKDFTPTVPIQFKFSSTKPKKQHLSTVKENINNKSSPNFNVFNQHKASIQTAIIKPQIQIPTTAKYIDMVNFNQQKLEKRHIEKIREQEQEKQRKLKQIHFAKFMRKKLKNSFNHSESLQNLNKSKLSHHKYEQKLLKKQNEEEMCRIYEKVMARPFLFQSNSPKFTKAKKNHMQQPNYVPMKKKNRVNWKKNHNKQQRQVHHSPLKELEAEIHNQSQNNKIQQNQFEFQSQNQEKMNYLNQSF